MKNVISGLFFLISAQSFAGISVDENKVPSSFQFSNPVTLHKVSKGQNNQSVTITSTEDLERLKKYVKSTYGKLGDGLSFKLEFVERDQKLAYYTGELETLAVRDRCRLSRDSKDGAPHATIAAGPKGSTWTVSLESSVLRDSVPGFQSKLLFSEYKNHIIDFALKNQNDEELKLQCASLCVRNKVIKEFNSCDETEIPDEIAYILKSLGLPLREVENSGGSGFPAPQKSKQVQSAT